jgi:lipoprotein-anchoring transpeptidase ErfK/SrfK
MVRPLALLGAALVVALLALYWYDSSRSDRVAEGVRAGGVDLGGLPAPEARRKLETAAAASLRHPVVARRGERPFTLDRETAAVRLDAARTVEDAVERSRDGSILVRTARSVRGTSLKLDLPARVAYSQPAVAAFVRRVERGVDRPPREATVRPSGRRLARVPSRTGAAVEDAELRRRVERALGRPGEDRPITVPWKVVQPKVTVEQLPSRYPNYVVIDRDSFELRYYRRLKLAKTYRIAVGQAGLETPAGLFDVQGKQVNPHWLVPNSEWAGDMAGRLVPPGPENPLKARWIGFNGAAGIHGTADVGSLGTAASHGCIRMSVPDVTDLYRRVHVNTPVYVQ